MHVLRYETMDNEYNDGQDNQKNQLVFLKISLFLFDQPEPSK